MPKNKLAIDPEIIRKLAHSGIKTLGSMQDLLEFYDMDKEGGLHNAETRKLFHRSLRFLSQALRDMRLLAICEEIPSDALKPVNWKSLLESGLSGRFLKVISFSFEEANYEGNGYVELLSSAVANLAWFTKNFWKSTVHVRLGVIEKEGVPWVHLEWDFGNEILLDPTFSSLAPFYPMFPKESLSLDKSTGLALHAVNRILELHGGMLSAQCSSENLKLTWTCPKDSERRKA